MSEIVFEDDGARGRYRALIDGDEVGFIEYDPIGADAVLLKHTEVHRQYEGRGIGSKLVSSMLDDVRRRGKRVVPICPYALAFVRRHPEFHDVVRDDLRSQL